MSVRKAKAATNPDTPVALSRTYKFYGLRTSDAQGKSHGGFQWPLAGEVVCPEWDAVPKCGNGLHALLNGEGSAAYLNWNREARWQLVGFDDYVDLDGKVKFERCEVATGSRLAVTTALRALTGGSVHGGTATAGDGGTATAGYSGTATAGDRGTATAGDGGTATAGDRGTATAGDGGTATAGYRGIILIRWYDGKRYRIAEGYVGEDGIKPNVAYRCDAKGKLAEVQS